MPQMFKKIEESVRNLGMDELILHFSGYPSD